MITLGEARDAMIGLAVFLLAIIFSALVSSMIAFL